MPAPNEINPSADFVECPADSMLETYCWNGTDLDAADHKSHMSTPVDGACPDSHPVSIPKMRMVLRYPLHGDPARFRLASGPGYTMHGDFSNAWPEDEIDRRVRGCINVIAKCDHDGRK